MRSGGPGPRWLPEGRSSSKANDGENMLKERAETEAQGPGGCSRAEVFKLGLIPG